MSRGKILTRSLLLLPSGLSWSKSESRSGNTREIWTTLIYRSMDIRHMNVRPCLKTIPDFITSHQAIGEVRTVPKPLPLTPWSDGKLFLIVSSTLLTSEILSCERPGELSTMSRSCWVPC
jgi:hypothetical protein